MRIWHGRVGNCSDAPRRVVVVPLQPQYWCFESGFTLNHLARLLRFLFLSPALVIVSEALNAGS